MAARPDLVVAIDFGMTCTGVAYCKVAEGSTKVRNIQKWPGKMGASNDKVPTLLVYPKGSSTPTSWGFLAESMQKVKNADQESREWFKIMLDETIYNQMREKATDPSKVPRMAEIEQWYRDYFQYLYRTIQAQFTSELASRWEDAKIEFIFSVPTTWKPVPTVERFRKIISLAGFGSYPTHVVSMGLTEAEAAAVDTASSMPGIFKENELLLVCDIGGGTTDLSVFRVKNTVGKSLNLEQVDVVFGATIGAAQLDTMFQNFVLQRLERANQEIHMGLEDLEETSHLMRYTSEYQNAKCGYGSAEFDADTPTFSVQVPDLNRSYVNTTYRISRGEMEFHRQDLKPFFDVQISKLYDLIGKQLARIQQKLPNEQVAHLVLSGGLGSSAYVQACLRSHFASGNTSHTNARNMQIRKSSNPQLVVCQGNVANRVRKLNNNEIIKWRCCRASYGTMCKMIHEPQNPTHFGLRTEKDPLDGKVYVVNCIDWFIKQGEPVSSDHPIVRTFHRKCSPASAMNPNPNRIFPTEVISSEVDKSQLPVALNDSCRRICKVESDFSSLPLTTFKLKNRHWWNSGPKYHRINFAVKVNMGPADISFELWHNGIKLSKDNSIKVEWQESAPPATSATDMPSDLPMNSLPAAQKQSWNSRPGGVGNGGFTNKGFVQTHVTPMPSGGVRA